MDRRSKCIKETFPLHKKCFKKYKIQTNEKRVKNDETTQQGHCKDMTKKKYEKGKRETRERY